MTYTDDSRITPVVFDDNWDRSCEMGALLIFPISLQFSGKRVEVLRRTARPLVMIGSINRDEMKGSGHSESGVIRRDPLIIFSRDAPNPVGQPLLRIGGRNYLVDFKNVPGAESSNVIVSGGGGIKAVGAHEHIIEIGAARSGAAVRQLINEGRGETELILMRSFNSRPRSHG